MDPSIAAKVVGILYVFRGLFGAGCVLKRNWGLNLQTWNATPKESLRGTAGISGPMAGSYASVTYACSGAGTWIYHPADDSH